ncbi:MAG: class I SAM-dependent methyltransferase [Cyclobacteriaceae bacterium]|uniref:Class I SAM-dependent methyltransferase n=1 Tax=Algoriphagus marincola TaxID=264027 RepID=A0ABS7NAC2_9BACT|nr:class I SAM-dependent methyltransferase [Algoriphagus marincola]MBY5952175.1 class I SAM-dependent methyltransferase [Algoriphagus marincola]MCR9081937.1 class I SAM-dependent methyltransferase [Cyclobacteriaceae bacterium]
MKDNYRLVGRVYRPLSRLVFGKKLSHANAHFLSQYLSGKTLIIGGGEGYDYREFQDRLSGEYWELSESMLNKAKENLQSSELSFHLGSFRSSGPFDLVLLPFVLDTLTDEQISKFLHRVDQNLKPGGMVILSDFFKTDSARQSIITALMIAFFRLVAGHCRKDLPDHISWLSAQGWILKEEKVWKNGWIRAQVWVKD